MNKDKRGITIHHHDLDCAGGEKIYQVKYQLVDELVILKAFYETMNDGNLKENTLPEKYKLSINQ